MWAARPSNDVSVLYAIFAVALDTVEPLLLEMIPLHLLLLYWLLLFSLLSHIVSFIHLLSIRLPEAQSLDLSLSVSILIP